MAGQMAFALSRISSLNTCLYVAALISPGLAGEKVRQLQGSVVQSSSFIKMPRYSTEGLCIVWKSAGISSVALFSGISSAHHFHGDTPAMRDSSSIPYAVPRPLLPATVSCFPVTFMQKASFRFFSVSTSMPAALSAFSAALSLSICTMRTLAPLPSSFSFAPVTSIMSSPHICIAVATTGDTPLLSE